MSQESDHSPVGASSCERWWNCPGSVALIKKAPTQKPNKYAVEGTVAHEIGASWLSVPNTSASLPLIGDVWHEEGFEIKVTEEMLDAVGQYVNFIQALEKQWETKAQIEVRTKISDKLYGTADAVISVDFNRLIVVDFKYGAGVKVTACENKQLMYYGLGALLALPPDERSEIPLVEMIIVRPRGMEIL